MSESEWVRGVCACVWVMCVCVCGCMCVGVGCESVHVGGVCVCE